MLPFSTIAKRSSAAMNAPFVPNAQRRWRRSVRIAEANLLADPKGCPPESLQKYFPTSRDAETKQFDPYFGPIRSVYDTLPATSRSLLQNRRALPYHCPATAANQ